MSDVPSPTRARMSFPKTSRILKKLEYKRVLDSGSKVVCHELVVFAIKSHSPRLGMIVSRKVGNAVTRNRVKRFLREAFRQDLNLQAWDIVVIARQSAANSDFKHVCRSLGNSLRRLKTKLEPRLDRNKAIESKMKH